MLSISQTPAIRQLSQQLAAAVGQIEKIRHLYESYVASGAFHSFVSGQLESIAEDPRDSVQSSIGQVNLTAINTSDFDLTFRYSPPLMSQPHPIKWQGYRQILTVIAGSPISIRRLRVPPTTDINAFAKDVPLSLYSTIELREGDFIQTDNMFEILDIERLSAPSLLCSLTVKNSEAHLHWSFNAELKSVFAEAARMISSRVQIVMEVADAMSVPIPRELYARLYEADDPHVSLFAIRKQLADRYADAFLHLHEAIDATNPLLRAGAHAIFDVLVNSSHRR